MTQDIIDTFTSHLGVTTKNVTPENNCIFMPYIIMDVVREIYQHEILPAPIKFKANHLRKEWKKSYTTFNTWFFEPFTIDQSIEITDKMDEYAEYIAPELKAIRESLERQLEGLRFADRKVCVARLLCNILTKGAEKEWELHYDQKCFRPNKFLGEIIIQTYDMAKAIYPKSSTIVADAEAVSRMGRKTVKWAFNDIER